MSGPYFHSADWVRKLTLAPITWTGGAAASRFEDTGAIIARESSATAALASSQACPQALLSPSPLISSPPYSPPPATPPTPAPESSLEPTLGSLLPLPVENTRDSPLGHPPDSLLPCPLAPRRARRLARPPWHPTAPIESNDPISPCAQMVRNSLDRLSGDREAMMKPIEPLSSSIRRLEKKCEEILVKIRSRLVDRISFFTPFLLKRA